MKPEQIAVALRRYEGKAQHQRAAEELLVEHDYWLRRKDFLDKAMLYSDSDQVAIIRWGAAQDFIDSSPIASSSELSILELATAIGSDRYRFTIMGDAHREMIREAFNAALSRKKHRQNL